MQALADRWPALYLGFNRSLKLKDFQCLSIKSHPLMPLGYFGACLKKRGRVCMRRRFRPHCHAVTHDSRGSRSHRLACPFFPPAAGCPTPNCVVDWPPKPAACIIQAQIASLKFTGSRTFSAGSATWCGHLRLRAPRVISPLRRVMALSPSASWQGPCKQRRPFHGPPCAGLHKS